MQRFGTHCSGGPTSCYFDTSGSGYTCHHSVIRRCSTRCYIDASSGGYGRAYGVAG